VALFNAFNERTFQLLVVPGASPREAPSAATSPRAWRPPSRTAWCAHRCEKRVGAAAHAEASPSEDVIPYLLDACAARQGLSSARSIPDRYSMETAGRSRPAAKAALQPGR
jgi:hypothetical protein